MELGVEPDPTGSGAGENHDPHADFFISRVNSRNFNSPSGLRNPPETVTINQRVLIKIAAGSENSVDPQPIGVGLFFYALTLVSGTLFTLFSVDGILFHHFKELATRESCLRDPNKTDQQNALHEIDVNTGRILDAIREGGIAEKTVVACSRVWRSSTSACSFAQVDLAVFSALEQNLNPETGGKATPRTNKTRKEWWFNPGQRSAKRVFPKAFFGTVTASYQVKGAWNEDG